MKRARLASVLFALTGVCFVVVFLFMWSEDDFLRWLYLGLAVAFFGASALWRAVARRWEQVGRG